MTRDTAEDGTGRYKNENTYEMFMLTLNVRQT